MYSSKLFVIAGSQLLLVPPPQHHRQWYRIQCFSCPQAINELPMVRRSLLKPSHFRGKPANRASPNRLRGSVAAGPACICSSPFGRILLEKNNTQQNITETRALTTARRTMPTTTGHGISITNCTPSTSQRNLFYRAYFTANAHSEILVKIF